MKEPWLTVDTIRFVGWLLRGLLAAGDIICWLRFLLFYGSPRKMNHGSTFGGHASSILTIVSLTPPHARTEKRRHHLSFPWHPVDCACTKEGRPHQRKEAPFLNFDCCVFLLNPVPMAR